ncbi:hypothetical protein AAVH_14771, partial [Aphelenchoides avenae]
MCIYIFRQEFTQPEAEKFCAARDAFGFLAFMEQPRGELRRCTSCLYENRGHYANVPEPRR